MASNKSNKAGSSEMSSSYNSVRIHLFEAKDLPPMDRNKLCDPFCKFRLGGEKFRSRVIKKTLSPQWMEQFEIHLYEYDTKLLEISLWDWDRALKNELIGRVDLDLSTYEKGQEYDMWLDVKEKGARRGSVHISVLVNETRDISDFLSPAKIHSPKNAELISETQTDSSASLSHVSSHVGQVGSLSVKILSITNLPNASPEGKSLYCALQLGLARVQTHTIPKSSNPEWNCHYNFPVHDIHSVLEISVLDRDMRSRTTLLGSLAVPLLNMKSGQRRLYTLKDKKLLKNAPSSILLEFNLEYDMVQAVLRTVRPKDNDIPSDLDKEISSQVLYNKVAQIRKVVTLFSNTLSLVQLILNWDDVQLSGMAYAIYLITVSFFQPYWIPLLLLLLFLNNYLEKFHSTGSLATMDSDDDVDSVYSTASDSSSVFTHTSRAKFAAAEDLINLIPANVNPIRLWSKYVKRDTGRSIFTNVKTGVDQGKFVKEVLEFFAEQYEKSVNTFNFTVPWLSYLAISALAGSLVMLYFLPFRLVMVLWGTFEFGKGFCGVRGVELLSILSRVHTNHEARMYSEITSSS